MHIRRITTKLLAGLSVLAVFPLGVPYASGAVGAQGVDGNGDPPVPGQATNRIEYIQPKPPGTRETITLQWGPFEIPPGTDTSRGRVEIVGADGFIVGAKPSVVYADGTELGHDDGVHMHHAHLFRLPGAGDRRAAGPGWVYGTGSEHQTGSLEPVWKASPGGPRYGIPLKQGERLLLEWMPMNMTQENKVVWLQFEIQFVHGSQAEIQRATGQSYHPLTPVLFGRTFNVPQTGGRYAWPLDWVPGDGSQVSGDKYSHDHFMSEAPSQDSEVVPGKGIVWTAPSDGVIMIAGGHFHRGGKKLAVSNLGSTWSPCPDDGDRFPGTTLVGIESYAPEGLFPSRMLQMGFTQPAWRAEVQKGDRIAINGVYDTTNYAYPDQMAFAGLFIDQTVNVSDEAPCAPTLVNEPNATHKKVIADVPSQDLGRTSDGSSLFHHVPEQPCVADECNDHHAPKMPRGPHTNTVVLENYQATPGGMGNSRLESTIGRNHTGAPVLKRGETLSFVNLDYAKAGVRHNITSCHGPCNGPTTLTYPNADGLFYSGPMGYVPLAETGSNENQATPTWQLDTSKLETGYYTWYCRHHPSMRGAFYVASPEGQ